MAAESEMEAALDEDVERVLSQSGVGDEPVQITVTTADGSQESQATHMPCGTVLKQCERGDWGQDCS